MKRHLGCFQIGQLCDWLGLNNSKRLVRLHSHQLLEEPYFLLGSRWWIPHFYRTRSLLEYPQWTKWVSACIVYKKCPEVALLLGLAHDKCQGSLSSLGWRPVSTFPPTAGLPPQVSFRYHCQLYSEWRKTNQKVRLKIREADGSEDPHHSLLATGLLKKVAEETPV